MGMAAGLLGLKHSQPTSSGQRGHPFGCRLSGHRPGLVLGYNRPAVGGCRALSLYLLACGQRSVGRFSLADPSAAGGTAAVYCTADQCGVAGALDGVCASSSAISGLRPCCASLALAPDYLL